MTCCKNVSGPASGGGGTLGDDGGGDRPRRFTAAEKGKMVLAKKRKASDGEAEVARAVATAAETVKAGGHRGSLRIGSELMTTQRCGVLVLEQQHGPPPGTVMIGGHQVQIDVREFVQEEPAEETEAHPEE